MTTHQQQKETHATLAQIVAHTCFCKLRSHCSDRNASECLQHKNIYAEFMAQKRAEHLAK